MSIPDQKGAPILALESGLYIVATPIGNLGDISKRACDILAAADIVAVEDSRVTGKLLNHLGLKRRMQRYNDHAKEADRLALLAAARSGIVALVSDAGTPLISDPGYKLVRAARGLVRRLRPYQSRGFRPTASCLRGLCHRKKRREMM
jgi:16S rRNA (cytidine1402-2'-O)-methyltransferase